MTPSDNSVQAAAPFWGPRATVLFRAAPPPLPVAALTPSAPASSRPYASGKELHTPRPRAPRATTPIWPVVFCAFVAGVVGGIAVMTSPVGNHAAVRRAVKATQSQVSQAQIAARAAF